MGAEAPTRRAFLAAAAAVAAGVAVGAAGKVALADAPDLLRPPGSLPEPLFSALCIKCERCTSVCPTSIIKPVFVEDGALVARGPELDFSKDYCIFCDECRKVCPTGAIQSVDPLSPADGRIGAAHVFTDTCLAFYEVGACGICVDACEYGALSFDSQRRPVVDAGKCNGCGNCVKICPANVLTSFGGSGHRGIGVLTELAFSEEGR